MLSNYVFVHQLHLFLNVPFYIYKFSVDVRHEIYIFGLEASFIERKTDSAGLLDDEQFNMICNISALSTDL